MSHSYPNKPYIVTRASKSAALTHDEMDFNLASLVHKITTSSDGSQVTFSYAPIKEGGTTIQNDDVVVDVLPSAEYITKKLKYENLELGDVQADTVIAGTVKAGNLSVDENIVATGSVTASGFYTEGKIFAYNRIDTDGDLVVGNDLRVDGVISASLIADPNNNFVINSDGVEADHFYAYSDIYAEGNIHAEGHLIADENLTILESASVAGDLRVTGSTHLRGHLYAGDNIEVFGTLKASPDGEGQSSWSIYDGGSAVFKELHATGSFLARNDGVYIKGIGNYTGGSLPDYSSVDLATVLNQISSSAASAAPCKHFKQIESLVVRDPDGYDPVCALIAVSGWGKPSMVYLYCSDINSANDYLMQLTNPDDEGQWEWRSGSLEIESDPERCLQLTWDRLNYTFDADVTILSGNPDFDRFIAFDESLENPNYYLVRVPKFRSSVNYALNTSSAADGKVNNRPGGFEVPVGKTSSVVSKSVRDYGDYLGVSSYFYTADGNAFNNDQILYGLQDALKVGTVVPVLLNYDTGSKTGTASVMLYSNSGPAYRIPKPDTAATYSNYVCLDYEHTLGYYEEGNYRCIAVQIPDKYLVKYQNDSVFEAGAGTNSVQQKEVGAKAISEASVAIGKNSVSGLKGFYYKHIQRVGSSGTTVNLFLSATQVTPTMSDSSVTKDTSIKPGDFLEIGDILSIINDSKYYECLEIINFLSNGGGIQAKWIGSAPFNSISTASTPYTKEDYSIFCVAKPNAGISDLVDSCVAMGAECKSVGGNSVALGYKNETYGKFGFSEGRENKAGYAAHAEGQNTQANGTRSHSEGYDTIAEGNGSHAEGQHTKTVGQASHAEGYYTQTPNVVGAHAEGTFNNINGDPIHSVGIGTNFQRKNAFTIMKNGDAFLLGVGGYNGTNPSSSTPINQLIGQGGGSSLKITGNFSDFDNEFTCTSGHSIDDVKNALLAGTPVVVDVVVNPNDEHPIRYITSDISTVYDGVSWFVSSKTFCNGMIDSWVVQS